MMAVQSTPTAAEPSPPPFVDRFACPLTNVLESIYGLRPTISGQNKFLVAALDDAQRYVQCRVIDEGHSLLCEASSGFYGKDPFAHTLQQVDAIRARGFEQRREGGNYSQQIALASRADFSRIARLLLATLRDGFGARDADNLFIKAPGLNGDLRAILKRPCASQ